MKKLSRPKNLPRLKKRRAKNLSGKITPRQCDYMKNSRRKPGAWQKVYVIENDINCMCYVGQTTRTLEKCYSNEQQDEREIFWIATFNSKRPNGYNLNDGGNGNPGYLHTVEARAKMSAARMGNKNAVGNKNFAGHKHSPETKAKIFQPEMQERAQFHRIICNKILRRWKGRAI